MDSLTTVENAVVALVPMLAIALLWVRSNASSKMEIVVSALETVEEILAELAEAIEAMRVALSDDTLTEQEVNNIIKEFKDVYDKLSPNMAKVTATITALLAQIRTKSKTG